MFTVKQHETIFEQLSANASPLHKNFWRQFLRLLEVPRPSYHHGPVVEHLEKIAKEHGWECTVDETKNVLMKVPATAGMENAPIVCLQGHTDIVYVVRPGVEHSKLTDPVVGRIDGDWLKASGTTLGGDNGVAVAMALAIAETEGVAHGPLELMFTSDEEVGLIGASAIKTGTLKAKYLLNLDSEDEDELTIGCAGGMNVKAFFDIEREMPDFRSEGMKKLEMTITGLRGGHTGVEIHDGRLSGIIAFARVARHCLDKGLRFRLAALNGGAAHNAICSSIVADLTVHADDVAAFRAAAEEMAGKIFHEFRFTDPDAKILFEERECCCPTGAEACKTKCSGPLTLADTRRIINYALIAPFGPISFSKATPGLVETSFSTTKVTTEDGVIEFLGSARSSVESANDAVYQKMCALCETFGARVSEQLTRYPAWEPLSESELVNIAAETYRQINGKDFKILAIHAGLECGVINAVHPGLQSISIGPNLYDVHTPDERLGISSTARTLDFTAELLKKLAH